MKRKTMAFRLTLLTAALGLASTASAQLVITQLGTQTLITFDADTPGIYHARTPGSSMRAIYEPNVGAYELANHSYFFSNGVASQHSFEYGGNPTQFANDGDGNGQTNNEIGQTTQRVYHNGETDAAGLSSNALRLSNNNDWAINGWYFRIQNNTGSTVTAWNFKADLFIAEPDPNANEFSNIQFAYAVNNGNNPATMTFTTFGGSPNITQNMTLSGTAAFQLNSTVSASVANGNYIVLAFRDIQSGSGSTVFIDNIGITAVPEASTYALIGLGLAALFTLRRFSAKSS
jgi:hypothetical protein